MADIYSPPRVTAAARRLPKYGPEPGLALDITIGDGTGKPFDFSRREQRQKVEAMIDARKPLLLIGSPMCTAFSAIQAINRARRDPEVVARELTNGRLHLAWCCHLYRKQVERGACFLHEHPAGATSWHERCVVSVLSLKGVRRVRADQCMLGQQTEAGQPILKSTGFMPNSPFILDALDRR